MTNTRDSERVPTAGQVTGEVTVYEPMTILDLSDRGAQVETKFALHLGSLHEFRLSLGERSVVVKGRIAHCQIGDLQEGGTILYLMLLAKAAVPGSRTTDPRNVDSC
jgi:hypothetical protein